MLIRKSSNTGFDFRICFWQGRSIGAMWILCCAFFSQLIWHFKTRTEWQFILQITWQCYVCWCPVHLHFYSVRSKSIWEGFQFRFSMEDSSGNTQGSQTKTIILKIKMVDALSLIWPSGLTLHVKRIWVQWENGYLINSRKTKYFENNGHRAKSVHARGKMIRLYT